MSEEIEALTGKDFQSLLLLKLLIGMLDLLFMTFTVYLLNSRDIRDEFVRRGLYFLFIATALRVLVSLVAAFTPPTDYGQMLAV